MSFLDALNRYVWSFRRKFTPIVEYDFNAEGEILENYVPIHWSTQNVCSLVMSGCFGSLLGIFIATIIDSAFVELTLSSAFSIHLGLILNLLGMVILKRSISVTYDSASNPIETENAKLPRKYILIFSILMLITGVGCVMLEIEHFMLLGRFSRAIFFGFIGMSLAFGLSYALVDLINFIVGWIRPGYSRPLVEFALQIYVVIAASLCLGLTYGILYSIYDYRNEVLNMITFPESYGRKEALHLMQMLDWKCSFYSGGLWGALAGVANGYILKVESAFNQIEQPIEFETDI